MLHVTPIDDLKEHTLATTCECEPKVVFGEQGADDIVIHNSFDGRENFEWDNEVRQN